MRIISGEARGRRLFAPSGEETRPTADRIRESLFNILGQHVRDARVLDLFGGSGAMSLEALSRGAAYAIISDHSRIAVQCIERNAKLVLSSQYSEKLRILRADYRAALDRIQLEQFDLVFLDPPYRMTDAYTTALRQLHGRKLLRSGCICVLERDSAVTLPLPDGFVCFDSRNYGTTSIDFLKEAVE
ncbi:MAG: 16S rRNA (guanine(966)-N(2))-methyltransferase RsmD [Christensenellales bacterium]|nr:16S rRNA (guanine(966)-N(2))-methyltransferase RsmD [Christensenellales bacterium]